MHPLALSLPEWNIIQVSVAAPNVLQLAKPWLALAKLEDYLAQEVGVFFPCTSAALRTNQSFRDRYDIDHHNYYSCIEELETVDMVLDVPVDPMHLVDEGAGKKLFMTIMEDTDYKISPYNVRRVNEDMSSLSKFTPREFARRSRPFPHNLKSTEWSQALKYTCPVIFRNRLSQERYEHMLTLHVAVKILSSERFCIQFNAYAKSLLQVFAENASRLYGKTFITYNFHNIEKI